eukprot:2716612-Rhodomonas_salina.1
MDLLRLLGRAGWKVSNPRSYVGTGDNMDCVLVQEEGKWCGIHPSVLTADIVICALTRKCFVFVVCVAQKKRLPVSHATDLRCLKLDTALFATMLSGG